MTRLFLQESNVESLAGTSSFCCFITKTRELYYLEKVGSELQSIFITDNVKNAFVNENGLEYVFWDNVIHFADYDNCRWIWRNKKINLDYNHCYPMEGFVCVDGNLIHRTENGDELIDIDVLYYGHECYIKRRPKCRMYN